MTSFPQFASLPLELQREVWQASLNETPEPGVHIFKSEDPSNGDLASFTIDISWPTLMHVCRESRSMARRQLKFRGVDRTGACLGPYRAFDTKTDTIYVSTRDWSSFFWENAFASWRGSYASLRHLALDARALDVDSDGVSMFVRCLGLLSGLQTVSVVFSDEGWVPRDHVPSGNLVYQLVDCAHGDAVWHAPPNRVKRQDMDPWDITKAFREDITGWFRLHGTEITDWEHAPFDHESREFDFDIIPRRIVPRRNGVGHGAVDEGSLISSMISRLRGLMPSNSR